MDTLYGSIWEIKIVDLDKLKEVLNETNKPKEVRNIQEQLLLTQIEQQARVNFEKSLKTLNFNETDSLKEKFKGLDNLTEVLTKSKLSGLICVGNGGIGKSYKILKKLNELKADFSYFTAFSTPLELYHTLYENNGKIIILDDVESLLDNSKCVSLLKNALWGATGTRVLNYKSTSELLKAPKQFEFTGKLIIITNKIGSDVNLKALVSRVLFCDLKFDYPDILFMMNEISKNDYEGLNQEQRNEVVNFIKENSNPCILDFNLRILIKSFEIYKNMANWKEMVKDMLKVDDKLQILYEILQMKMSVKDQIDEFYKKTGHSRITYFRLKRQLVS